MLKGFHFLPFYLMRGMATHNVMAYMHSINRIYYAPLKVNRNVVKANSGKKYQQVNSLLDDYMKKKLKSPTIVFFVCLKYTT